MESLDRIAVVDADACKPKKCNQECKRNCPVVRMGRMCIEVTPDSKVAFIAEEMCIGCGLCVQRCPFGAIRMVNLPKSLSKDTVHRYLPNGFKLHRLPLPRRGRVLGLVGENGTGKTTAMRILSGKLKPNLGKETPPEWSEILKYFRGSELQNYFTHLLEDKTVVAMKPQYVDAIPAHAPTDDTVGEIIARKDQTGDSKRIIAELEIGHLMDRKLRQLSGGELQRFAVAVTCMTRADVRMFDEPTSYLDVRQRLRMARLVRSMATEDSYVIVAEHDLSILDWMSDYVCMLYGTRGLYGVVTFPSGTATGINIFLEGYLPSENMRFRKESLSFSAKMTEDDEAAPQLRSVFPYAAFQKSLGNADFCLKVDAGDFSTDEVIGVLGQNGTGKSTYMKILAGVIKPDQDSDIPQLTVSYKPQNLVPKEGLTTVRQLLHRRIPVAVCNAQFISDVMRPLLIEDIENKRLDQLSGGELQRVAIAECLGQQADLYLLDEPSAYLDAEQRVRAARIIRRHIRNSHRTALVIEHDLMMISAMADRLIIFDGTPGRQCHASRPMPPAEGLNSFLVGLDLTVRSDSRTGRPRINKPDGQRDKEQKRSGKMFLQQNDS